VHSSVSTIKASKWVASNLLSDRSLSGGRIVEDGGPGVGGGTENWGRATVLACAFEIKINAPVTHQIVFANVKSEAHR
jgi:hypothetical protein